MGTCQNLVFTDQGIVDAEIQQWYPWSYRTAEENAVNLRAPRSIRLATCGDSLIIDTGIIFRVYDFTWWYFVPPEENQATLGIQIRTEIHARGQPFTLLVQNNSATDEIRFHIGDFIGRLYFGDIKNDNDDAPLDLP
jgi:hypothetical protein